VRESLSRLGPTDAVDVWRAIALARPGGMGTSDRHDLRAAPPADLLDAMRAAAHRDQIARLWATGYADLFTGPVADLAAEVAAGSDLDDAIVRTHLRQLAREPDTLIARRHGADVAADVSRRAREVLAVGSDWRPAAVAFDHALRFPKRVNPGTTADLIAAALYILLREGRIHID
jgi:triphosphoribosyl-dephospho-CoA synthase